MVTLLAVLFTIICPLIIFIILVQDPKGGGLAGVLGGAGGTAAFGAKTADVVMKTTVVLGIVFFLLALGLGLRLKEPTAAVKTDLGTEETVETAFGGEQEAEADESASDEGEAPEAPSASGQSPTDAPAESTAPPEASEAAAPPVQEGQ